MGSAPRPAHSGLLRPTAGVCGRSDTRWFRQSFLTISERPGKVTGSRHRLDRLSTGVRFTRRGTTIRHRSATERVDFVPGAGPTRPVHVDGELSAVAQPQPAEGHRDVT